jgi:hypothetical protein
MSVLAPADRGILESVEKRFCRPEIGRVEPLRKPLVDRLEERRCLGGSALIALQPGEARGGAQFPGQNAISARPVECLPEVILGPSCGSWYARQQQKLTFDAQ